MSSGTNESTVAPASRERCVSTSASSSPVVRSGVSPERIEHLRRAGERRLGAADRVARAARLLLHDRREPFERLRRVGRDDDDERLGCKRTGRLDDPVDHPPAEDLVQVLRRRRAHARATASGHDDGCERGSGCGHGGHVGWGARIRTWDHGTKTRCLTAWPRPSESGRPSLPGGAAARSGPVSAGRGEGRQGPPPRGGRRGRSRAGRRSRPRRGRERRSAARRLRPTRRHGASGSGGPARTRRRPRRRRRRARRRATTAAHRRGRGTPRRSDGKRDLQPPTAQAPGEAALPVLDDVAGHLSYGRRERPSRADGAQQGVVTQVRPTCRSRAAASSASARAPKRP